MFLALVKISLNTMESKIQSRLFFAGEVVVIHNICMFLKK